MGINLLKLLTDQLGSGSTLGLISRFLGESESNTSSALGSVLPSLLGGLMSKSSTPSGASSVFNMLTENDFDGGMLDNLSDVFGGGDITNAISNSGGGMLDAVLGNKLGGIMDLVGSASGISRNSSSSLLKMGLPLVMSLLGKFKKEKSLDASGLASLLASQKDFIKDAAPAGLGSILGLTGLDTVKETVSNTVSNVSSTVSETASNASSSVSSSASKVKDTVSATTTKTAAAVEEKKAGMGWLWPLLGLLFVGGLIWYLLTGSGKDAAQTAKAKTTQIANKTGNALKNGATATTNAAKNGVTATGNAIKNGSNATVNAVKGGATATVNATKGAVNATTNAAGKVVDGAKTAGGKVVDGAKGAVNATTNAAGKAVGGVKAAGASAVAAVSATSANIAGFFKAGKKDAAINLDQLKFDENNEIAGSDAQVQMLVKALQANPKANIRIESFAKNKLFGNLRGQKVQNTLSKAGIARNRIKVVGKAGGEQTLIFLQQ